MTGKGDTFSFDVKTDGLLPVVSIARWAALGVGFTIGDIGGHAEQLDLELSRLGVQPDGSLPDDLVVIQVGDLIHRGPDSDQVVAIVDRYLRAQPAQWIQLSGGRLIGVDPDHRDTPPIPWRRNWSAPSRPAELDRPHGVAPSATV